MKIQRIIFLLLAAAALTWIAEPVEIPVDSTAEIPQTTHYVALTFDDGPRADTTSRLLDGLRERGASATFFLIGEQIAGNEDLVTRMKAEGHQVGNHTWSHVRLQGAARGTVLQEVKQTDDVLRKLLGDGSYWVRPPYGLINRDQKSLFSVPLVHWSVDPEDWKLRNADADVAAVLRNVQGGDIILMHDSVPASVDAALRIIDTMQAEGYEFVTVEELLAMEGVEPQAGVLYRSAAKRTA